MKRSIIIVLSIIMLLVSVVSASADTSTQENENPLEGKSVLFVGDSVCEGWCEWTDPVYSKTVAWAGRIMAKNNMTGINKSLGGASISNCRKDNTVINQLKAMAGNKYDLVILQGGVNDAWDSCPVGRMSNNFDGPYNNSTFAGGLEETLKYAKETFPDAIIAFTITFSMPKANYGYISNMTGFVNMTKKICDKWEVPYLDLYNDEDLNKNQLKTDTTECLPDYIHPNSKGYNILAPVIEAWMKTLFDPKPEESVEESVEESAEASVDESQTVSADESLSPAPQNNKYLLPIIIVSVVVAAAAAAVIIVRSKKK